MLFLNDKNDAYYHIDYCSKFISPERSDCSIRDAIAHDFTHNLVYFLVNALGIENEVAFSASKSLYALMSSSNRHYHTTYHVLRMFMFAHQHEMNLKKWEQLALWFHLAAHCQTAIRHCNEHQSIYFMRAVLPNGYCLNDNSVVNAADMAILQMGELLEDARQEYYSLLDLTLSIYAAPSAVFDSAMFCLRTEFCQQGGSMRRFKSRERKTLSALLAKNFIFRTPMFRQKYEHIAKANAARALKQFAL